MILSLSLRTTCTQPRFKEHLLPSPSSALPTVSGLSLRSATLCALRLGSVISLHYALLRVFCSGNIVVSIVE